MLLAACPACCWNSGVRLRCGKCSRTCIVACFLSRQRRENGVSLPRRRATVSIKTRWINKGRTNEKEEGRAEEMLMQRNHWLHKLIRRTKTTLAWYCTQLQLNKKHCNLGQMVRDARQSIWIYLDLKEKDSLTLSPSLALARALMCVCHIQQ